MIMLGVTIIIVRQFTHIPKYLCMYAFCTIAIGISLLLYSILDPEMLPIVACLTSSLSFMSCAFFCFAVHLRLNIQMNWRLVLVIIAIAEIIIFYYSWIDENYTARLIALGITPVLIFSHNLKELYSTSLYNLLDRILRFSLILLILITSLRVLYLLIIVGASNSVLGDSFLRSSIQFIILYVSTALTCLLMCCAYQDILQKLRLERNEDPLTGLLNRRALTDQIEYLRRNPISLNAVVICDLDHFKKINDEYGHHVGDLALKHISKILKNNVRLRNSSYQYDTISRIGGEEFMIILPNTTQELAVATAERIRSSVDNMPFIFEGVQIYLTMSLGVSFFHFYTEFDEAIQNADQQLYRAKSLGRNRVQVEF